MRNFKSIKKIASAILLFSVLVPFFFACKHDKGSNTTTNNTTSEKELVLDSFKVGDSVYQKDTKKISVTVANLKKRNIKEVAFKDASGNAVDNVAWDMDPEDGVKLNLGEEKTFKIVVKAPPAGFKSFDSGDITVMRELVAPKVTKLSVHGVNADLTKDPFEVRIPHPTVDAPFVDPSGSGKIWGDINILFDKDVPLQSITWTGLPNAGNKIAKPEDFANVTFTVAEKAGSWKAGEYRLKVIFDTPVLSLKSLTITGQDGDTEFETPLKVKVNLQNNKDGVVAGDIAATWEGAYIEAADLAAVQPTYEGLPLSNLAVGTPKTFKLKVAAVDRKYKSFEAEVTVMRANQALVLTELTILGTSVSVAGPDNFKKTVSTETTFVKKGDIKAKFTKPDGQPLEVDCALTGGARVPLEAGVENNIGFKVPATTQYAEYRGVAKIKHNANWENMMKMPIPDGGVTFKSGGRNDDYDRTISTKFEIGQFPVSKQLWDKVCDWAAGQPEQKGYKNIDVLKKVGQNGSFGATSKKLGTPMTDTTRVYPVTLTTYHAAIVWCNMYSEMKGYAPVYYKPEKDKLDVTFKTINTPYTFVQEVKVADTLDREAIDKLVLRDALDATNFKDYTDEQWNNIRDNYIKAAMLTAEQAKCDDKESGFRLIQTYEWEFAGRLTFTKHKDTTTSLLNHEGKTYYFANQNCAPGSLGFGSEGSEIKKVAWCSGNSAIDEKLQTHPIGTKPSTDLGIYDLSGNVGSWTNTFEHSTDGNGVPKTTETKTDYYLRVIGGGFDMPHDRCMVSSWGVPSVDARWDNSGLRLVRTLK